MTQLPFDPDQARGADPPPPPPEDEPKTIGQGDSQSSGSALTVSQLALEIKDVLASGFPSKVTVVGEVSNLSNRQHWFFSLKDASASLRCVCFASNARRIRSPIEDGMQVIAHGRIDFYDAQGNVQLYVDTLEPAGLGELERQLRQRMEELSELGYFAPERKKQVPLLPGGIAIVTSASGAALQDYLRIARQRFPGTKLYVHDVRVQGRDAAPQIAAAIRSIDEHGPSLSPPVETVVVTRGGGSLEDLWAFNERVVADAIYQSKLPVVAAIGHEVDTTIAELVADLRCATPSHAAQATLPERETLDEQVMQLRRRLLITMQRNLQDQTRRVEAAARHPLFRRPEQLVIERRRLLANLTQRLFRQVAQIPPRERQRLERLEAALPTTMRRRLTAARELLDSSERELDALSPQRVLDRGFSYTLDPDGNLLRQPNQVKPGDLLTTRLSDGQVQSRVDPGKKTGNAPANDNTQTPPTPNPRPRTKRKSRRKKKWQQSGPGLFD